MSDWSYGGNRIYVTDMSDSVKQEIARLQPLRYQTIHHVFGWESAIYKVRALVVGKANKDHLETLIASGVPYTLDSPYGDLGDMYPSNMDFKVIPTVRQTIDTLQDCTAPVYELSLELYKEDV